MAKSEYKERDRLEIVLGGIADYLEDVEKDLSDFALELSEKIYDLLTKRRRIVTLYNFIEEVISEDNYEEFHNMFKDTKEYGLYGEDDIHGENAHGELSFIQMMEGRVGC